MSGDESQRRSERLTLALEIEYRSAGSFLVTYSVNLSRGGLFIETDAPLPTGTPLDLRLRAPQTEPIALKGVVAWARLPEHGKPGQPPGMGIQVTTPEDRYGTLVDAMASRFAGIKLLLALPTARSKLRAVLHRHLASILACRVTDVEIAPGLRVSHKDFDLALVEADDGLGERLIESLRAGPAPLPVIGLSRWDSARTRARQLGAAEVLPALPSFSELRAAVIRLLTLPSAIK